MSEIEQPTFKLETEVELRDKDGKLLFYQRKPAHSLLKNFALALQGLMYAGATSGHVTLTDTSNSTFIYPNLSLAANQILTLSDGSSDDTYGIQCGTGTAGVVSTQYQLAGKIANGNGSGQLAYGAVTVSEVSTAEPVNTWIISRVFTNNYSASITVTEMGLVFDQNNTRFTTIARDLVSPTQTVVTSATLTLRYIFSVSA